MRLRALCPSQTIGLGQASSQGITNTKTGPFRFGDYWMKRERGLLGHWLRSAGAPGPSLPATLQALQHFRPCNTSGLATLQALQHFRALQHFSGKSSLCQALQLQGFESPVLNPRHGSLLLDFYQDNSIAVVSQGKVDVVSRGDAVEQRRPPCF